MKVVYLPRDTRRTFKRLKEKWNQKIQEKSNTCNKRLYIYILCLEKKSYFVQKHGMEKPSLYHYVCNVAFCVTRYLERVNETPTSIKICIGLVDVVLQPETLCNKLDILS